MDNEVLTYERSLIRPTTIVDTELIFALMDIPRLQKNLMVFKESFSLCYCKMALT